MNDSRDEWIGAALRSRAEDSQPRDDCPHPERIWSAVRLELSLNERLAIIDHLAECATCAESWRLAAKLAAAHEETVPPYLNEVPEQGAAALRARLWGNVYVRNATLAVASLALLLGVTVAISRVVAPAGNPTGAAAGRAGIDDSDPVMTQNDGRHAGNATSGVAQTPEPPNQGGASSLQDGVLLRWTAGPMGSTYDVTVMTADMDVVAEARGLEANQFRVPVEQLVSVASAPLVWRVVVHPPEGPTLFFPWTMVSVPLPPNRTQPTLSNESDRVAIMRVLGTYKQAIESKDLALYRSVRPGLTPAAEAVLRKTFSEVDYWAVTMALRPDLFRADDRTATVDIARDETFTLRADPRRQLHNQGTREVLLLEKTAAGWVILH